MQALMIIYKTTNKINGKCYVGQDSHDCPEYLGSGKLLNYAIKKYGRENFEKETMAWCDTKEHLNFLEKMYIDFFNSKVPNGYNLSDGGMGGDTSKFHPYNEEWKKKISESLKGRIIPFDVCRKMSESRIGKPHHNEESRKKMSETLRGRVFSLETRRKMSESGKDNPKKPQSEEHKRKIGESKIGKIRKPFSEEWKIRMSESQKKRWKIGGNSN